LITVSGVVVGLSAPAKSGHNAARKSRRLRATGHLPMSGGERFAGKKSE
jgi:hypothetical protein